MTDRKLLGKDRDGNDVFEGDTVEMLDSTIVKDEYTGRRVEVKETPEIIQLMSELVCSSLEGLERCSEKENGHCVVLKDARLVKDAEA